MTAELNLKPVLDEVLAHVDDDQIARFVIETADDEYISIARTDCYNRYSFNAKLRKNYYAGHFPADTPPLEIVKRIAAMASK